jgi:hypothetical protein
MTKHERPVKPETIDKRSERREANRQKQPWPLKDVHKFDKWALRAIDYRLGWSTI